VDLLEGTLRVVEAVEEGGEGYDGKLIVADPLDRA
jgi:hypothetical protein